jgi:hypothetical protein
MGNTESINNFLFTLFGFRKTKSKTHLAFIVCIHLSAWCLFLLVPLMFYPIRFTNSRFLYSELLSKLLPVGFFYLNYYFLLPRLFEKKKYWIYSGVVVLSILLIAAQEIAVRSTFHGKGILFFQAPISRSFNGPDSMKRNFVIIRNGDGAGIPPPFQEKMIFGMPRGILFLSINRTASLCIVLVLIGGLIRLSYSFLKNQNERKALENAHLNAEVNFLKSQINPHFLFNTLNGIYSQAHSKSEHTEYSILKLSELLRYVLYESGEEKVLLEKDILYLTNYIDLQRMRLSSKVTINYTVAGNLRGYVIAPLLLISFIENAFKHGISYSQSSVINIQIKVFEKTLTLLVSNPVLKTDSFATGGLGLRNVTRRLALLYPDKHQLEAYQNDYLYIVNLKIDLESD